MKQKLQTKAIFLTLSQTCKDDNPKRMLLAQRKVDGEIENYSAEYLNANKSAHL